MLFLAFVEYKVKMTHVAPLCNASGGSKTTLYLSHMDHAGHAHDLQHPIIVSWLGEQVLSLRSPRVGP